MKLAPCPFCSGEARLVHEEFTGGYWVECTKCKASSVQMFPDKCDVEPLLAERWNQRRQGWKCGADRSGVGGNTPQDCEWPCCGCDPHADKVIAALQEEGKL